MEYRERILESAIRRTLERGRSVLLFGARQTGKTTLAHRLRPHLSITLAQPDVRLRYEKAPGLLRGEVEALAADPSHPPPLVLLDEVQKVPELLDAVQDLIDRNVARFILTGSSSRKLRRRAQPNLLPGRVAVFHLAPLSLLERIPASIEEALLYGSLPGIVAVREAADREQDLAAYVTIYLEEEIRAEAAVRNLGSFARFLELAAAESGGVANLRRLASDIGVAHTTIAAYYQILEDCLVAERVEPLTESATRKKLTRSDKYLFFDMGVRRLAAREGRRLLAERWGALFEQYIGLELLRWSQVRGVGTRLRFWRDPDGPEVDWVVECERQYVPIEVKWTDRPDARDIRHLHCFLDEYPGGEKGYLVCRTPRRVRLSPRVDALPWQDLLGALEAHHKGKG